MGSRVFLGEYAANDIMIPHIANTYGSALAEGMQWNHNLIWFNPEYVMKTPNYFVQQMYGADIGKKTLSYDGKLPKDIYVSPTVDQNRYFVKIVNAGNREAEIQLVFPEDVCTDAQCITLQNENLKAVNTLSFKGEPTYEVLPFKTEIKTQDKKITYKIGAYSINVFEVYKTDKSS